MLNKNWNTFQLAQFNFTSVHIMVFIILVFILLIYISRILFQFVYCNPLIFLKYMYIWCVWDENCNFCYNSVLSKSYQADIYNFYGKSFTYGWMELHLPLPEKGDTAKTSILVKNSFCSFYALMIFFSYWLEFIRHKVFFSTNQSTKSDLTSLTFS